ncbi:exodeoxyribonuclease_III [Hexamita inflata]|uniref:Exodeoxyribonuclease III n=1 Tax=Hexamita inflata TaxID=28002 RepID=A0AA86TUR8_9EUKA|nr:exodeoxyribonuclease III [Hexamita inflata]
MNNQLQKSAQIVFIEQNWIVNKDENNIRIISFNINELNPSKLQKFETILKNESPDIICLQETKCSTEYLKDIIYNIFQNYKLYYGEAKDFGNNLYQYGTAILIKKNIPFKYVNVKNLLQQWSNVQDIIDQGRIVIVEIAHIILINVYVPYSRRDRDFRDFFDCFLRDFVKDQYPNRPLIITGDFNSTDQEYDQKIYGCKHFEVANFHKLQEQCGLEKVQMEGVTIMGSKYASQIDHFLVRGVSCCNARVLTNYYDKDFSDHIPIAIDVEKQMRK